MRESYAERKTRERVRDEIHAVAWEIAEHVAGANILNVEKREVSAVQFSARPEIYYCECGLPMIPMPQHLSRFGWLPLWLCAICSLDSLVREYAPKIVASAERRAAQVAA